MWHTPSVLLTSAFFHRKSATLVISRNTNIDWILIHILIHFFESLKVALINMIAILIMTAKLALGLLKVKIF